MASALVLDAQVRLVANTGQSAGACGACFLEFWVAEKTAEPSDDEPCSSDDDDDDEPWWLGGGRNKEEVVKPKGLVDWIREDQVKIATEKLISHPGIYALSLFLPATPREIVAQLQTASIVSADKSLLVLYTGPDWHRCASSERYLVCDVAANANALFAAPPIDLPNGLTPGYRPVVMRHGEGSAAGFTLALLVGCWSTRQHSMLLWSPSSALGGEGQQWVLKDAIPKNVVQLGFKVDVAFAYQGRWACWVDLHQGILTCDLLLSEPQFQLKPLPMEDGSSNRGNPFAYSTVGCVDGKIRLLYMHGFDEYRDGEVPDDEITIMNWTLEGSFPDDCEWVKHDKKTLTVGDLWSDESFRGLPKCIPTVPVLSPEEPDVIHFILNDVDKRECKGQYALSLNLQSKKVQSWIKCSDGSLEPCPSFVTADLGAYKEPSNPDDEGECNNAQAPQAGMTMASSLKNTVQLPLPKRTLFSCISSCWPLAHFNF